MKKKPAPILNPGTLQPVTLEELSHIFCEELAKQELDWEPHIPLEEGLKKTIEYFRNFV